jgi:hypothetical protein
VERIVYIKPPREAKSSGVWKLRKAAYGLKDAARVWYLNLKRHVESLGGKRSLVDNTLFYWKKGDKLVGIMCSHVDDLFYGGTEEFVSEVIGELKKRLKVGTEEIGEFKYVGVEVLQRKNVIWLHQTQYAGQVREFKEEHGRLRPGDKLNDEQRTKYRSIVGQLNWLCQHTRPDVSFEVSFLSRSNKIAYGKQANKLDKVVRRVREQKWGIKMERIEKKDRRMIVYVDASLGGSECGKSQIGYLISVEDGEGNKCHLAWKSALAKRVATSTIEAETLALMEGVEMAMALQNIWEEVMGEKLEIVVRTDSKTLSQAVVSTSTIISRKLMINLAAIREQLEKGEIKIIEWVNTKQHLSDVFTNDGLEMESLSEFVGGGGLINIKGGSF